MMKKSKIIGFIVGGIVVACIVFVVALFLVKALWAWTIPDLFPGAVEQGLVAGTITWLTSLKVAILIAILSAIARGHQSNDKG